MKQIKLTQNKVALVDDEDFIKLSGFYWRYLLTKGKEYASRRIKNKTTYMHRIILEAKKGQEIDHINGNGLDNQKFNLRICTRAQNQQNQKIRKDNTSGFKGVFWCNRERRWVAKLTVNKTVKIVGYFKNFEDAKRAYILRAKKEQGEFFYKFNPN